MLSLLLDNTPLFLTGVFLFGLIIGSFLNVVIYRLPIRMEHDWRCQCRELLEIESPEQTATPPSLSSPPSACPDCDHRIRAWENIPVLSYVFLRGKCSACSTRISLRYPAVELFTGLAFLAIAWHLGPTYQTLAGLTLAAFLIALAGIDADHQLLPDNMTLPLLWLGLAINVWGLFATLNDAVIGAILGYGVLWIVFQTFKLLTGKEGMGFGDFKLMGALGAWFGWQALPLIIVLSSAVGAVIGILILTLGRHKKSQPIPFGPFIAMAGLIYLLWGVQISNAYLRYSGLAS